MTFTPSAALSPSTAYTVTITATDGNGGTVQAGGAWSFTTATPPGTPGVCPCTLFDDSTQPGVPQSDDGAAVTLGVRFSPTVDGTVTGVRFYKGVGNTGSHVGSLWSVSGTRLATGTFSGESSAGWQTLTFDQPVSVSSGAEYVASYRTGVGRYSYSSGAFGDADLSRPPLRVTRTAGAYSYADGYPGNTASSSYLVDVVFLKAAAQVAVASATPAAGATGVARRTPVTVELTAPVASGWSLAVTRQPAGTAVAGSTSVDASGKVVTFTPSGTLAGDADFRAQLSGVVSTDGATLPTQTWAFRTRAPDPTSAQTMFSDDVPRVVSSTDSSAIEVGTSFRVARAGTVTAVRFFKGDGNTGTHTGALWTSSGTRLATVTFTNETASRVADRDAAHAGRRRARHDVRRVLPGAGGALLGLGGLLRERGHER